MILRLCVKVSSRLGVFDMAFRKRQNLPGRSAVREAFWVRALPPALLLKILKVESGVSLNACIVLLTETCRTGLDYPSARRDCPQIKHTQLKIREHQKTPTLFSESRGWMFLSKIRSDNRDVRRQKTLGAFFDFKLNCVTVVQALESVA